MKYIPTILLLVLAILSSSCTGKPWDESTKPVRLEMKLVVDASDEDHLVLGTNVLISNSDIAKASVGFDRRSNPLIQLKMTTRGAETFSRVTENNVDKRIAIVVDGQVFAAPTVRAPIRGGQAQVTLPKTATSKDADAIVAGILKYNSVSNKTSAPYQ